MHLPLPLVPRHVPVFVPTRCMRLGKAGDLGTVRLYKVDFARYDADESGAIDGDEVKKLEKAQFGQVPDEWMSLDDESVRG